jgi:hypothetical protein
MTHRALLWLHRWWKWRRWEMTVPDPPPAADPPGEKRLIADDDLPDPATAEPPDPIVDAPLREPPTTRTVTARRYDPPPAVPIVSFRGIVKHSMTKKTRMDASQAMVQMCTLGGWQSTTLNPDMTDSAKLAILTNRFGKLAVEDDAGELYHELIGLSAVTLGWAQGIARREARDRKRRSRERKRIRRDERKRAKKKAGKDKGKGG